MPHPTPLDQIEKPPQPAPSLQPQRQVWVYLLECVDGSYYCGVAVDVAARFGKHLSGKGAAYTRSHKPVRILGQRAYASMSLALKAEITIKKQRKSAKLAKLFA